MTNMIYIEFPKQFAKKLPLKRVLYLGQYYCGPALSQSLEKLWLKRKPSNRWVFQAYEKGRVLEIDECDGDTLIETLSHYPFVDEIDLEDLRDFGWLQTAEIISLSEHFGERDDHLT